MWEIGQAIQQCQYIEIDYLRLKDKAIVRRKARPVAIMFSEYYFYMIAFIEDDTPKKYSNFLDDAFPTIYRIDRIISLNVCEERFRIPYRDRFEEGEFRKRMQFMCGGKLHRVKFKYSGWSIEAVLAGLSIAKILEIKDGVYTIAAEVFGKGLDVWLKGQGEYIEEVAKETR